MANMITEDCIACGACEDECPNGAISLRDEIFVIDPTLCSECVGQHERPKCAEACPVDCCVPDPSRRESQDVLLSRARDQGVRGHTEVDDLDKRPFGAEAGDHDITAVKIAV